MIGDMMKNHILKKTIKLRGFANTIAVSSIIYDIIKHEMSRF